MLLVGGMWTLELCIRTEDAFCKQDFLGHSHRSMEDSCAECHVNYEGPAQELLEESNISEWTRDCFCDVLAKNVAAFCSCSKTFPEAKLKSSG